MRLMQSKTTECCSSSSADKVPYRRCITVRAIIWVLKRFECLESKLSRDAFKFWSLPGWINEWMINFATVCLVIINRPKNWLFFLQKSGSSYLADWLTGHHKHVFFNDFSLSVRNMPWLVSWCCCSFFHWNYRWMFLIFDFSFLIFNIYVPAFINRKHSQELINFFFSFH